MISKEYDFASDAESVYLELNSVDVICPMIIIYNV